MMLLLLMLKDDDAISLMNNSNLADQKGVL